MEQQLEITPRDHDHPSGTGWMRTISGKWFKPCEPNIVDLDITDIAHALAHCNRYAGHTVEPYSVAEHSIYVASMLWRQTGNARMALSGLLHDAAEAYIGDMINPLKRSGYMDAYCNLDTLYNPIINEAFDVEITHPWVKQVDFEIMAWEMAMIRDSVLRVAPKPHDAYHAFLNAFTWYQRGR